MNLKINVHSWNLEKTEEISISDAVFGLEDNSSLIYEIVRWSLMKKRQGTACTKGVSEVSGSTKKKHPQKESGKSRIGDGREPGNRGGGVSGGPKPRDHSFKMNKKQRMKAKFISLSQKYRNNLLFVVDGDLSVKKTSEMKKIFESLKEINKSKKVLFVYSDIDSSVKNAASNLVGFNVLDFKGLNALDVLKNDLLIMDKKSINTLNERLEK
ncbi:50S ribosomal protein L4 [Candidatus Nesciobacter abundans]|uniref:Large ribosomal subunit protein uL4 n=1 Tax=Candidatus Nesciobacter abundans TaxID=2601668 RepID=A0A5C0UHR3_9PROT|nr:50S ribosomal protein L4 [Candidatus Nesciobacter abundans]QEK38902.1 50S ribosomal protein L4 [Candidatus Nesciobacter abundans]